MTWASPDVSVAFWFLTFANANPPIFYPKYPI
jgi:hypothetical protein